MSSKFIISENDVVIVKDSKTSRSYRRLAVANSVIVSRDTNVRGAKVRLLTPMFLRDLLICFTRLRPPR